jgi:hypothetical protein
MNGLATAIARGSRTIKEEDDADLFGIMKTKYYLITK